MIISLSYDRPVDGKYEMFFIIEPVDPKGNWVVTFEWLCLSSSPGLTETAPRGQRGAFAPADVQRPLSSVG